MHLHKPHPTNSQKIIQFSRAAKSCEADVYRKKSEALEREKWAAGEGKQLNKITLPFTR